MACVRAGGGLANGATGAQAVTPEPFNVTPMKAQAEELLIEKLKSIWDDNEESP